MKEVIRKQKALEGGMGGVNVAQDEAYAKYLLKMRGEKESELSTKFKNLTRAQIAELMAAEEQSKQVKDQQRAEEERKKRLEDEEQKKLDKEAAEKEAIRKEIERREVERVKEQKKKEKKEAEKAEKAAAKAAKEREERMKAGKSTPSPSPSPPPTNPTPTTSATSAPVTAPSTSASAPTSAPTVAAASAVKPAEETKQKETSAGGPKVVSDEWSADEQAALEKALKTVGKDKEGRWDEIATLVSTKNKKQCIARFKQIREQILKQKEGK